MIKHPPAASSGAASASEAGRDDPEAVARKILLDQLTGRARSRSDLAARLAQRDVPEEIAGRLLDRFEEVGLVDDAAFARGWVEQRQAGRGLARRALAQELRRKGIDDEVAREALDEIDPDDEVEAARTLVRRRLRTVRDLDQQVAVRRLSGMLARKGYPPSVAFRVVREEQPRGVGRDLPGLHVRRERNADVRPVRQAGCRWHGRHRRNDRRHVHAGRGVRGGLPLWCLVPDGNVHGLHVRRGRDAGLRALWRRQAGCRRHGWHGRDDRRHVRARRRVHGGLPLRCLVTDGDVHGLHVRC